MPKKQQELKAKASDCPPGWELLGTEDCVTTECMWFSSEMQNWYPVGVGRVGKFCGDLRIARPSDRRNPRWPKELDGRIEATKKYNHVHTLAFEVASNSQTDPTSEEVWHGLWRRLKLLRKENPDESIMQAAGDPEQTEEFDDQRHYQQWLAGPEGMLLGRKGELSYLVLPIDRWNMRYCDRDPRVLELRHTPPEPTRIEACLVLVGEARRLNLQIWAERDTLKCRLLDDCLDSDVALRTADVREVFGFGQLDLVL